MARHFLNAPFDAATQLKDAGAMTATGVTTVASVPKILDVGAGMLEATLQVDISAIDTVTGDEAYELILQGSNSPSFASGVKALWRAKVGGASTTLDSAATPPGRLQALVLNSHDGMTKFRYLRLNVVIAGTTPSINFIAFLTKQGNKTNG